MTKTESRNLKLGLYRVYWTSGGWSVAAIGMKDNGDKWLAPTNWVGPTLDPDWDGILRVELIATQGDKPMSNRGMAQWTEHIRAAQALLETVLDAEDVD
jgi:hypothetical protein